MAGVRLDFTLSSSPVRYVHHHSYHRILVPFTAAVCLHILRFGTMPYIYHLSLCLFVRAVSLPVSVTDPMTDCKPPYSSLYCISNALYAEYDAEEKVTEGDMTFASEHSTPWQKQHSHRMGHTLHFVSITHAYVCLVVLRPHAMDHTTYQATSHLIVRSGVGTCVGQQMCLRASQTSLLGRDSAEWLYNICDSPTTIS